MYTKQNIISTVTPNPKLNIKRHNTIHTQMAINSPRPRLATLMWGPRMQPPCGGPWGVLTWVGPANASKASPRLRLTAHMTASVSNREMPCRAASRSYLGRAGAGLRWCLGKERCLARQCLLGRCWSFASQPHLGWNHAAALVQ